MWRREDNLLENETRIIRLNLTRQQMDLLVSYAKHHGFKRKHQHSTIEEWNIQDNNNAAKWAIMSRLGFDE